VVLPFSWMSLMPEPLQPGVATTPRQGNRRHFKSTPHLLLRSFFNNIRHHSRGSSKTLSGFCPIFLPPPQTPPFSTPLFFFPHTLRLYPPPSSRPLRTKVKPAKSTASRPLGREREPHCTTKRSSDRSTGQYQDLPQCAATNALPPLCFKEEETLKVFCWITHPAAWLTETSRFRAQSFSLASPSDLRLCFNSVVRPSVPNQSICPQSPQLLFRQSGQFFSPLFFLSAAVTPNFSIGLTFDLKAPFPPLFLSLMFPTSYEPPLTPPHQTFDTTPIPT